MKRRFWIIVLCCLASLAALAIWKGGAIYCDWRARRLIDQAREMFAKGKFYQASIAIRASLAENSQNPDAYKLMADLLETVGSSSALAWRQHTVESLPGDVTAKIALARSALRFSKLEIAASVLKQVDAENRHRTDFLEVEGGYFSLTGDREGAIRDLKEILARDPNSRSAASAKLNLARLWLGSTRPNESKSAKEMLDSLAGDPLLGPDALRLTIEDASRRRDWPVALGASFRLGTFPQATFQDRQLQLEVLVAAGSPLGDFVLRCFQLSVRTAEQAASLGQWMLGRFGPGRTIEWLNTLQDPLRSDPTVLTLRTACLEMTGNWSDAENILTIREWNRMESSRLALLARVYRRQGQTERATEFWGKAMRAARNMPGALTKLADIARVEGWETEAAEALWEIPITDPDYRSAQADLFEYYRRLNDANHLLELFERALELTPDDLDSKRSVAVLRMITGRQVERAYRLAAEIYQSNPNAIDNAAVYAYSLHLQGKSREAAAILDARPEAEKLSSACEPYYGIILASCERDEESRRYLGRTDRGILFPEMQKVVAELERKWK